MKTVTFSVDEKAWEYQKMFWLRVPPNDLILQTADFREYKHQPSGYWHRQSFVTNVSYDLNMACIRRKRRALCSTNVH